MAIALSTKRLQIDKANTVVVASVAIAAFLTVFSIFASKALLSKRAYQSRVIAAKQTAAKALTDDVQASNTLVSSYQTFVQQNPNLIGGSSSGPGDKDGDNAKIVLDALPSEYDFPALTSSIEKMVTGGGNFTLNSITGTDDSVNQSHQASASAPSPVQIPIELTVSTDYKSASNLVSLFEKSIRPFQIQSLDLSGGNNSLKLDAKYITYYQPAKNLDVTTEVIK